MVGELIRLAMDGTDEQKENAAGALWFLANDNPANRDAVRESGGIPVLVGLARDGTEGQKEKAAGVLWILVRDNPANCDAVRESGGIPVLVVPVADARRSVVAHDVIGGLTGGMADMLMRTTTSIFAHAASSAMPYVSRILVACRLRDDNPANRDAVRESGGISVLVGLARDGTDAQKESAASALGSLALNNPANGDAVRESGGVPVLVGLARDGTDAQ